MSPTITKNAMAMEPELRALHSNNLTLYQIARAMGITATTARRYLTVIGLPTPTRRQDRTTPPDLRVDEMMELRRQGETLDAIGKRFDLTRERVRQILQREMPDFVFPRRPGKSHNCVHCGGSFHSGRASNKFCSQKCKGAAQTIFNRDTALDVMRERREGRTWDEIAEALGNGCSTAMFRCRVQRYKSFFSAAEQAEFFPPKGAELFKSDLIKRLEQKLTNKDDQQSLTMRRLRSIFSLHRR